ncbi:alpha/beta fold hydrolase [Bartonella sp. DGB1]|uniref:alpha/beta fold hydrolase n=1 Tax=Bartonella sp. DGB1 TaxID=3239807 RepID=UPI003526AA6F
MDIENINFFNNNGINIAWKEIGKGEPILLIHGFASTAYVNWVATGWVDFLVDAGYRVILMDNRGHGRSEKLHDPKCYYPKVMAQDAINLLEYLNISQAHIMGYSMGARLSATIAVIKPELVKTLIMGGLGIGITKGTGDWQTVAHALLAESLSQVTDLRGRMFRKFAEHNKSDLKALAACVETSKEELTIAELEKIQAATLIVVGEKDEIAGDPFELADIIKNAKAISIPRRDHMLAVGDKIYKQETLEFLKNNPILGEYSES